MLFGIIRLIMMLLIMLLGLGAVKKLKVLKNKRRLNIIIVLSSFVLGTILCLIPFENAFITFNSPEKAFKYSNTNNIYTIVEGKNSALIVSKGSEATELFVIPKSEKGWKITVGSKTYLLRTDRYNTVVVKILKNKNTGDCYLAINDITGNILDISDNLNSQFYCVPIEYEMLDNVYNKYYAYIEDYDSNYKMIINGEEIAFN